MFRKALAVALLAILPGFARAQSAAPDMSGYQSLLDQYIRPIAAKGEPFDTRFDYEQLYVDEKIWTRHSSERLERLHAELLDARPSQMAPAERVAWGLNTYHFLAIERITLNLLVPTRKFLRFKSVDQIYSKQGGFFVTPIATVEGHEYSLEGFLRRFVLDDTSNVNAPRARVRDPRLLFAANPGRIGLAPLMPHAYRAQTLDRQLDEVTRAAFALPRFVTVKERPPQLLVSDWVYTNRADFGGTVPAMLEFVQKWAPHTVREGIRKEKLTDVTRYVEADPSLNQVDHPKVVMPSGAVGDAVTR